MLTASPSTSTQLNRRTSDAAGVVGNDTITFNTALTLDEPNLQGAGGADVINFNGVRDLAGTGKILGNAGGERNHIERNQSSLLLMV